MLSICQALLPNFALVLAAMPSFTNQAFSLGIKFNSDPTGATLTLLELVKVSDDPDIWKEFLTALMGQPNLKNTLTLFISGEQQ